MQHRWKLLGSPLHNIACFVVLVFLFLSDRCFSLNPEGFALMEFRLKVTWDPNRILESWNPENDDPCRWRGIKCIDGKVEMLNLSNLSLGGALAPDLGKLCHLRVLILSRNTFTGVIPKEIGRLAVLELLDLRENNLYGTIPAEFGKMTSLKHLWLSNNRFEGVTPSKLGKLSMVSEWQFDVSYSMSRYKTWKAHGGNLESFAAENSLKKENPMKYIRRRLLQETSNLHAAPVQNAPIQEVDVPSSGSGSFPAVPYADYKEKPSPVAALPSDAAVQESPPSSLPLTTTTQSSNLEDTNFRWGKWGYLLVALAVSMLLIIVISMLFMSQSRSVASIGPWKTGLSGQLQKALVTGVPKLNRAELEAACEDFSNIIQTYPQCTVYKGTLSSGVEIAVVSTSVSSSKDWSKRSEMLFRRKLDTLSRVNHKNFINLLGYCEEDEPFMRMMVFEYAPSGTLFEHLHVKEIEHLDWSTRMRIIMGIAYCLQYMHHELSPPVAHNNLRSNAIYLTDDYAAKIVEIDFWKEVIARGKISGDDDDASNASADIGTNIFNFGLLLLEIISGRPIYTEEHGSIVNWAAECLNEKRNVSYLIDPTLKSFKNNELDLIYEVIQECIRQDPKKRPTMKEVTFKLREVLAISPDAATPRLSPLWWAELEILSVEAS